MIVKRAWGEYHTLFDIQGCKVKTLTMEPSTNMSMQRHFNRNEIWVVISGKCVVQSLDNIIELNTHDSYHVEKTEWHQLKNPHNIPCTLIEVQYGEQCSEEDIERKDA
jgi:mannose-6-phosphate isomerase-like protein (cupin superfamily)